MSAVLPTPQARAVRAALTLVEPAPASMDADPLPAFVQYLRRRRMSETTIQLRTGWIIRFRRWLDTERPGVTLFTVTFDDIEDYVFSKQSWSRSTSATIVASMRAFYRWAHREGHVLSPLADDLAAVRQEPPHGRTVSDAVVMAAVERAPIADRAMLLLGAECGLRVAEIAKVRLEDRDGGWLTVVGKGNKRRKVWRRVRRLAGVNTHALRHRAGTAVYRNSGHDLRLTQEFLGHSSPNTTAIYVHVEDDELMKAGRLAALRVEAVFGSNRDERRELVHRSLEADPNLSDRGHAARTGVTHPTVAAIRREVESFTTSEAAQPADAPLSVGESVSTSPGAVSEIPCDGAQHSAGTGGHDQRQAAFTVYAMCPNCFDSDVFNLCAGRVHTVMSNKTHLLSCGACGTVRSAGEFWSHVERLEGNAR